MISDEALERDVTAAPRLLDPQPLDTPVPASMVEEYPDPQTTFELSSNIVSGASGLAVAADKLKGVAAEVVTQATVATLLVGAGIIATGIFKKEKGGEGTHDKPFGGYTAQHLDASIVEQMNHLGHGKELQKYGNFWSAASKGDLKGEWRRVRGVMKQIDAMRSGGDYKGAEELETSVSLLTQKLEAIADDKGWRLK